MLVFTIFLFFILGGWLIGMLASSFLDYLFPSKDYKEPNISITNHITNNHLHITKEDLTQISNKK